MELFVGIVDLACRRAGVDTGIATGSQASEVAHFVGKGRPCRDLVWDIDAGHDCVPVGAEVFDCGVDVSGVAERPVRFEDRVRSESEFVEETGGYTVELG